MPVTFFFVLLASFGLLALGVISPKALQPLVRGIWSRTRIALVFGLAFFFSVVGIGLTAPSVDTSSMQQGDIGQTVSSDSATTQNATVVESEKEREESEVDSAAAQVDPVEVNEEATAGTTAPSSTKTSTPSTTSTNYYTNVDGQTIESPSANTSGATGVCNDGTYTHATHHQGACSHHGGVSYWL